MVCSWACDEGKWVVVMLITESPAGHETFDVVAAVFNLGEVLYRSTADSNLRGRTR